MHTITKKSIEIGGKTLTFEHGKMAQQAQGSVLVTYGNSVILSTVGLGEPREGMDFFPLTVDFEAKFYATGKLKGSRFNKREGRASNAHLLVARMIDRPIRPMFPKGVTNEVQIICTLFQGDGEHSASAVGITGASTALLLAGAPIEDAIAGVRVGMKSDGSFFLDPNFENEDDGDLDLLVAGTQDAITMVEAGARLISNEKMLEALAFAHEAIKEICAFQKAFVAEVGAGEFVPMLKAEAVEASDFVNEVLSDADFDAVGGATKKEVKKGLKVLEEKLMTAATEKIEAEILTKKDLKNYFDKKFAASVRRRIFEKGVRVDGRKPDEIRPLYTEVGLFPRVHGSALFQRGETQALSMLTVGGPKDEKIIDDPDRPEYKKRYIHHYNFPPYSVGETRMLRGPGRREIGHGALAERALRYVLPNEKNDEFPYMMRVVSEILACNGSSSMASVCGSTLALMDGGIPIKSAIAGIAMGLVLDEETGQYHILSDIQGLEDAGGDMDFKVAGDENGITALQMDIKVKGLRLELLAQALKQAQVGRRHILENMKSTLAAPREKMNPYAPQIYTIKIEEDEISIVIGKGGETIQGMEKEFQVDISIEDSGLVTIASVDQSGAEGAIERIKQLTYKAQVGDVIENCTVKKIMEFGAFVEYAPKQDGLVHVSEIAKERVNRVEDYLKEGQKVTVKIIGFERGKVKLSMKQV
jgi:polyribonucleotide nucleotidyltransferase